MLTRRSFLESSTAIALAGRLFAAADSTQPNRELENLGAAALGAAKKLKASYADIRIIRYRWQSVGVRLNPERGTSKILEVPAVSDRGIVRLRSASDRRWRLGLRGLAPGNERRNRPDHWGGGSRGQSQFRSEIASH